jgi:hypothetical protein
MVGAEKTTRCRTAMNDQEIVIGDFRLDPSNACLWRGGEVINLSPKVFKVLSYLVRRAGQLVTRDELLGAVWPDTIVGEAALTGSGCSPAARSRSFRPFTSLIVSSASIQKSQSPRACRSDSWRAAEKSSHQGNSKSRAPWSRAISFVESSDPVSTTTSSSTQGRMPARQAGSVSAASRTIMQRESRGPDRCEKFVAMIHAPREGGSWVDFRMKPTSRRGYPGARLRQLKMLALVRCVQAAGGAVRWRHAPEGFTWWAKKSPENYGSSGAVKGEAGR